MESQPIMPALVHRTDLAPRARQLLSQQLEEYGKLLDPLVRGTLDDLEHELFHIAEQSSGGQAQHEAMEALREVKRNRPGFHAYLLAQLEHGFDEMGTSVEPATTEPAPHDIDELKLVDPREFDESMALDDLSTRMELRAGNSLFDLCHRYAVLLAVPPLENDALPAGPRKLAAALGDASHKLGLQRDHRVLFYRLCDRRVFAAAETIYVQLNEHLKDAGILAHLRNYLKRRGPAAPRSEDPEATADTDSPLAPPTDYSPSHSGARPRAHGLDDLRPLLEARRQQTGSHPGGAPANADGEHQQAFNAPADDFTSQRPRMSELHALLDARRHVLHPEAAAAAAQSVQFASMPELQEALATLQAMPSQTTRPQPGEKLSNDLMDELRRISDGGAVQLQPEHRDAMDLMGLLYDQVLGEIRTEGAAQQLLAGLQVPLLRVALSDSDFFTVRNHPARRLLNLVLETANLWLDLSGGRVDTALHQRLQRTVQRVAEKSGDDSQVIEREANELEAHLNVLSRRAEISERRHVDAAQGRDRLREARAKAGAAISKRIGKRRISPLVRALLENAWADALTLTLLREGEDSEPYKRRLAAADQVLAPATERDDTGLAAELTHGLTQVGLQSSEAEQVARYALELPQPDTAPTATPAPSQTELLIRLKSRPKPDATEGKPAAAAPKPLPLTPTERKALDVLKKLPFGSWLEFTVNQQGQKIAHKLAWYSPMSGRCLLVNVRGVPARERSLEQVARMVARGQARVLPERDEGMIDRAWHSLVAGLRKFGGGQEKLETAT